MLKSFYFQGHKVTMTAKGIHSDDETIMLLLRPLFKMASGGPEEGDPFLSIITEMFGDNAVTNIEWNEDDWWIIH